MTFPTDFFWGASSSAYQIEGASREGGKGPSVQDTKTVPEGTPDFTVCSDHYHRYVEDVALMAELGLKSYRFSIAWTRIIPEGVGEVNREGVDFYNHLLDELQRHGIEPIATLYHFDLPAALEAKGGWTSRETIDAFVEYAKVCFREFGDRITYWQTINEQNMMTLVPQHVVGAGDLSTYPLYQANHHMFVAQSGAMAACHEILPQAKIGPAPNISVAYANTNDPRDVIAAQYRNAVRNWIYLDAAVFGRYNTLAKDWIERAGYELDITEKDLEVMRSGRPDFIAMNYYNSENVAFVEGKTLVDENGEVHGPGEQVDNSHLGKTKFSKWPIDPVGLRVTLQEVHSRYNLPLMITENGLGEQDELVEIDGKPTVEDDYRIDYLRDHIFQMGQAIETGVPVIGYHPWSVMDLISTHEGFLKRYGFIYVNRDNASEKDLARYKKKSFAWYRKVIDSNGADLT